MLVLQTCHPYGVNGFSLNVDTTNMPPLRGYWDLVECWCYKHVTPTGLMGPRCMLVLQTCLPLWVNGVSLNVILQTFHHYGVQLAAGRPGLRPSPVRGDMIVETSVVDHISPIRGGMEHRFALMLQTCHPYGLMGPRECGYYKHATPYGVRLPAGRPGLRPSPVRRHDCRTSVIDHISPVRGGMEHRFALMLQTCHPYGLMVFCEVDSTTNSHPYGFSWCDAGLRPSRVRGRTWLPISSVGAAGNIASR
jgi:hypothetical protein